MSSYGFRLSPVHNKPNHVRLVGTDEFGTAFSLTLDTLLAANLCIELEEWIASRRFVTEAG